MTPPTKRARSDDEEHDQARSDDKQPPRAVMISYRVETEDRQLVDFWGEPWGPPQLVLLSDVKKYASLIYDMAEATEWHLFLDVSRDTSYDDDQPEDDTAVPTYHEHDSRNIDLVAKTLQGEVSASRETFFFHFRGLIVNFFFNRTTAKFATTTKFARTLQNSRRTYSTTPKANR